MVAELILLFQIRDDLDQAGLIAAINAIKLG